MYYNDGNALPAFILLFSDKTMWSEQGYGGKLIFVVLFVFPFAVMEAFALKIIRRVI